MSGSDRSNAAEPSPTTLPVAGYNSANSVEVPCGSSSAATLQQARCIGSVDPPFKVLKRHF